MKAAAGSMSLSSSPRAKSHYRNRIIKRKEQAEQTASGAVRAQNAAKLQLFMLTYQLLHVGRSVWHSVPGAPALGDSPSSVEEDTAAMPQECLVKPVPAALPWPPAESLTLPCAAPQNRESAAGVNRPVRCSNQMPHGSGDPIMRLRPRGQQATNGVGSTMLPPRVSPLPPPTTPRSGRRSHTCTSAPSGSEF